ncbi:exonuclease SbcCD subunit D [Paenochrobactrum sp. BZR 588]|uniref:metallophosphoesterase family protein n=1 Tax=unclassified Paenochrobactrum TaxID=2639760 RepID=UPI0038543002
MTFRFVHAADIHLDSPLRSLALRNSELAELIGNATRQAFVRIIDLCLEQQVDALLIAGDLYDGDQTSMKTARFLHEQLRRLNDAQISTFIIRGNHDALSRITKELVLPESVKLFGGRAEMVEIDHDGTSFPICIHGLSFAQAHAPDSLLPKYKQPQIGAFNIGLLHTSLAGSEGHDLYAPCSIKDLQESGFQYWALGHIHKRSLVEGACAIVMPGMPQGRDINEAGAKSVSLVTVNNDRSVEIVEHVTSIAQFERLDVNVSDLSEWPQLVQFIGDELHKKTAQVQAEHGVFRVYLTGHTALAWRIRRDADLLLAELEAKAASIGRTWVEKLEVACQPLKDHTKDNSDPLYDLYQLVKQDILTTPSFQLNAQKMADELKAQLPPECRDIFGQDEGEFQAIIDGLVKVGAENVIARLQSDESEA